MTALLGLCGRRLYGQVVAGQVGSKVVQVKGVMLLWQHTPGKHRAAKPSRVLPQHRRGKPSGDSGLNTLLAAREESDAGRVK